jgi:hypothetical protein
MTALSSVDIHSNATRLRPKPMLPNAAKAVRTISRTPKRASTCAEPVCGVFVSGCKVEPCQAKLSLQTGS